MNLTVMTLGAILVAITCWANRKEWTIAAGVAYGIVMFVLLMIPVAKWIVLISGALLLFGQETDWGW